MYLYVFNIYSYMKSVHVKQAYAMWRHDWYLFRILCYFPCLLKGSGFVIWKQSTPVRNLWNNFFVFFWTVLLVGISTLLNVWMMILIEHLAWVTLLGFHPCCCLSICLNGGVFLFFSFCLQGFSCLSLALSAKSEGSVSTWLLQAIFCSLPSLSVDHSFWRQKDSS